MTREWAVLRALHGLSLAHPGGNGRAACVGLLGLEEKWRKVATRKL